MLENPPACGASRLWRLESSRIALLFWGLGLQRLKVAGDAAPKPSLCRGLCLRRRPLALSQAPCARGLEDGYGCIATFKIFKSQVGAAAPTHPLSAALGVSYRRLAIAGNAKRLAA